MTAYDPDLATRCAHDAPLAGRTRARHAAPATGGLYRTAVKRLLDILLVLLSAPFVVPLVIVLAVIVRRDGGPAFYSQPRVGRGGRIYTMWKLRSMVVDADALLEAHLTANASAHAEWDAMQKLRHDPRITRIGDILRRSSLDELPQLWNVFIGDMSLVGPRPMMPCQTPLYCGRAYFRLRPGITGPWQVSARNESRFDDRVAFDEAYDRDLSLVTDVWLILRTFRVVLRATGR